MKCTSRAGLTPLTLFLQICKCHIRCLAADWSFVFSCLVCKLLLFEQHSQQHCHSQEGTEWIADLRFLWPKSTVKVVAVTADAFEDRWQDCLACGFDGWFAKPFGIEDMRHILEAVFLSEDAMG